MNIKNALKNKLEGVSDKTTETWIIQHIAILPELQSLIPPLSEEEYRLLETSLLTEGCRERLILWKKTDDIYWLVDGHNRYSICQKYAGKIPFKIEVKGFADIEEVKDWMINNQLGKRNVTEETKSYLRGIQYSREKNTHGGDRKSSGQNVQLKGEKTLPTKEKLAEQHKVSPKTIQRDEIYANTINSLVGDNTELKWKILNKEIQIPKSALEKIAKRTPELLPEFGKIIAQTDSFDIAMEQLLPEIELVVAQEDEVQQLVILLQKSVKERNKVETEKLLQELIIKIQSW